MVCDPKINQKQLFNKLLKVQQVFFSGDQSSLSKSRYEVVNSRGKPHSELNLLSRGVRDIDDEDDFEDNVKVPSCSELRKMWKIARRIHHHALKTNEIPQKLHPFSNFESDRFRTSQRIKSKNKHFKNKLKYNSKSANKSRSSKSHNKGSKEIADTNYGIVRYSEIFYIYLAKKTSMN